MSEATDKKQEFFHLVIEGHDHGLSPELRGLVDDFVRQMTDEYDSRKKYCYDLLKQYPDDEGLKQLWTPEKIEAFASGADNPDAIATLRGKVFHEIKWHD